MPNCGLSPGGRTCVLRQAPLMRRRSEIVVARAAPRSPRAPGLSVAERSSALSGGLDAGGDVSCYAVPDLIFGDVLSGPAGARLDVSGLPEPMRRELTWWVATCQRSGRWRLNVVAWQAWAKVAASSESARCSFSELDLESWLRSWSAEFYARRHAIAGRVARQRMQSAMEPFLDLPFRTSIG